MTQPHCEERSDAAITFNYARRIEIKIIVDSFLFLVKNRDKDKERVRAIEYEIATPTFS